MFDDNKLNFDYVYTYNINYLKGYNEKELIKELRREQRVIMRSFVNDILRGDIKRISFGRKLFSGRLYELYNRQFYSKFSDKWIFRSLCVPGVLRPLVDVDGNIYICEKSDNRLSIGKIDKDFYFDKINQLINDTIKILNSKCLNCWAIRLCRFCYVWLIFGDQYDVKKMDIICNTFKKSIKKYILWYAYILVQKKPVAFDRLFREKEQSAG